MGQAKRDRKMIACRSEMLVQTAMTGLPGQDFSVDLPRQDFQDMTSGIGTRADFAMTQH